MLIQQSYGPQASSCDKVGEITKAPDTADLVTQSGSFVVFTCSLLNKKTFNPIKKGRGQLGLDMLPSLQNLGT